MQYIRTERTNTNGERQPSLKEQGVGEHASLRKQAAERYSASDTPRPPEEVPAQDDRPERHPEKARR